MAFTIEQVYFDAVTVITPDVFGDERGFFVESYREDSFAALGITERFVQDNHSRSGRDVLRGLHFQWDKPMGKLLRVTRGSVLLVEVDIRKNSPTLGESCVVEVSEDNKRLVWVPAGFANGFLVTSDIAEVQYKCTAMYNPKAESGIAWNDPALNIQWGVENPIVSAKDSQAQTLQEWLSKEESMYFTV